MITETDVCRRWLVHTLERVGPRITGRMPVPPHVPSQRWPQAARSGTDLWKIALHPLWSPSAPRLLFDFLD